MTVDFSERDVSEDVEFAKKECKQYLEKLLTDSDARRKTRAVPVLALCGPGRCGKDLGADWLGHNFCIQYGGSLSEIVAPLIARALNKSVEDTFAARHTDRMYWFRFCSELRRGQPELLVRLLLAKADIIVGIRGAIELEACLNQGLIDTAIWIDNPRAPADPTLEYSAGDCHLTIVNDGTKMAFFNKLRFLSKILKLPQRECPENTLEQTSSELKNELGTLPTKIWSIVGSALGGRPILTG